jgi:hypothetical protein
MNASMIHSCVLMQPCRMMAYGQDSSAMLSPYLALGMLTPAAIHHAVQQLLLELQDRPQTADGGGVEAGCAEQQWQQQQQACFEGAEQLLMHLDIRWEYTGTLQHGVLSAELSSVFECVLNAPLACDNTGLALSVCTFKYHMGHTHPPAMRPLVPLPVHDGRDFFTWSALRAGGSLVSVGGPSQRCGLEWRADAAALQR